MATVRGSVDEVVQLAEEQPDAAVDAALASPPPQAVEFFARTAPMLPVDSLLRALDGIERITDPTMRAILLETVSEWLPEGPRRAALRQAYSIREAAAEHDGSQRPAEHDGSQRPQALLGLARNLQLQGELPRASELAAIAAESADEHQRVAALLFLASVTREMGDLEQAERVGREALELIQRVEGPESEGARGAMGNLALTLADLGMLEEARALQERVIALTPTLSEARLGAEGNLALTLAQKGEFAQAIELQQSVVSRYAERDGEYSMRTLKAMGNLASLLADAGRRDDASALRQRIHDLAAARYGEEHPIARRYERVAAAEPEAPRGRGAGAVRPSATIARDYWTAEDRLGHDFYADAIAEFILHRDTRPPLTIGIKAPWGAGKTSLMRMVRAALDPTAAAGETESPSQAGVAVTNAAVLASTRQPPQQRDLADAAEVADAPANTRRTVWFNAWKYQSGEQVWSGLAHAIISQLTERMAPLERERFWATLNLRRVDGDAVRRRIYAVLLERLLPLLAAALLTWALALGAWLVAPAVSATDSIRGIAGGSVIASSLALGVAALARRHKFLQESVKGSFAELVRVPDYAGGAGYMHAVHEDMRRVLNLVATAERPVVVFVDDLDRCSYESVAKVIEAINLFLAGEFPNCIFVLAMEPDLVAAQIEVAYKDLFGAVAHDAPARERGSLGWLFLEKMVQLPLSLPPPEPEQVERFIDSILTPGGGRTAPDDAEVSAARERIKQETSGGIEEIVAATRRFMGEPDVSQASLIRAAELEFAAQFSDQDEDVQALIRERAGALFRNPREIKRFINVFRFYAFIQVRREVRGLPAPSYRQLAKIAVLAVRWPHLLGYLGQHHDGNQSVLMLLEGLARREDGDWSADALHAAEIGEQRCTELARDDDLLDLLRADPPVAADATGFL